MSNSLLCVVIVFGDYVTKSEFCTIMVNVIII